MVFGSLPGFRINVSQYQETFIIGDYFVVYENDSDRPDIFQWSSVTSYVEQNDRFVISFGRNDYTIPKNVFTESWQLIAFRSIAEGQINKNINIKLEPRIVPPKYNYRQADLSENVFSAVGMYSDRDINAGIASHIYGKFGAAIWVLSFLAAAIIFACLWFFAGNTEKNLIFYIVISFFSGLALGTLGYLVFCVVARHRYSKYRKCDISTSEEMVFIVSPNGFGAIERCVYTGREAIPWSEAKFFYETKYSIVIVCKDKSFCCLPKKLFQKSVQKDISDFISARVEQD